MKKRTGIFLTAALILSACGNPASDQTVQADRPSVIAIVKAMDSLHWLSVEEGLDQAALQSGVDLNVLWPDEEDDVETQKRMIQDAVTAKPDALILAPCDSAQVQPYIQELQAQGTKLLYMDEEGGDRSGIPYVGSDNYHAGELAAEKLAESLPEDAKVAVIAGSQSQMAHQKRAGGFTDYIEKNTSLQVVSVKEVPGTTLAGGRKAMQEILEEDPDVAGVFCASAMLVMGALENNEATGRTEIRLVGMDTQSDALSALENGKILAMISQNGYEIGYTALLQAVSSLEGTEVPEKTYVSNEVITKETADTFLQKYVSEGRS